MYGGYSCRSIDTWPVYVTLPKSDFTKNSYIREYKERHQNSGEIPYLYNVKIESVTPSPSIFTGEFHPYVSWRIWREHQIDLYGGFSNPFHHSQTCCEKIIWGIWRPEEVISLDYWSFKQVFWCEFLSLQDQILRPPPPLSLHCKDREFHPRFDAFPNG